MNGQPKAKCFYTISRFKPKKAVVFVLIFTGGTISCCYHTLALRKSRAKRRPKTMRERSLAISMVINERVNGHGGWLVSALVRESAATPCR